MTQERQNIPWARKHDLPGAPLIPSAPRIAYPTALADLIELCTDRAPDERLRAAGSHWSLSLAAVSDNVFIETHDPNNAIPAMGRTLYEVVPACLSAPFIQWLAGSNPEPYDEKHYGENVGLYPIHMETGKRVYQAYAEMDFGDDKNNESLARLLSYEHRNDSYLGPWAFPTLGGAGGQTVFGALTTGTHGGDFRQPPIADSVLAMHLVVDGGRHYWIERSVSDRIPQMTDDDKLHGLYDPVGSSDSFHILRNDDLFNAVLVSNGRFGIVYSIVVGAVRQYSLHEERKLLLWQDVKTLIAKPGSTLYVEPYSPPGGGTARQKFLQIAVCLTTHANFTKNLAGVTKRWNAPMFLSPGTSLPAGREERVGQLIDPANPIDPLTGAPAFTRAGKNFGYSPNSASPGSMATASLLETACSNSDFMVGVIDSVAQEVSQYINTKVVPFAGVLASVAAIAGVSTLLPLLPALSVILAVLLKILAAIPTSGSRLGQTMNDLKDSLLNRTDPAERVAGLLIWQCIAYKLFQSQQGNQAYDAISYAVMDGHNYRDQSCNINVRSIEVFFRADDPMLVAFVDALIAFEARQEFGGKALVGYASLRFTRPTSALIGPERGEVTCAVEVSGLADVTGSTELVAFAEALALNQNFNAILHWGQQNNATAAHVERWFGDSAAAPGGPLGTWRTALGSLTNNGQLNGFSTGFTRRKGLEVVQPVAGVVTISPTAPAAGESFTIEWDCRSNPPQTDAFIELKSPDGTSTAMSTSNLAGRIDVTPAIPGTYTGTLTLKLEADGRTRADVKNFLVNVT